MHRYLNSAEYLVGMPELAGQPELVEQLRRAAEAVKSKYADVTTEVLESQGLAILNISGTPVIGEVSIPELSRSSFVEYIALVEGGPGQFSVDSLRSTHGLAHTVWRALEDQGINPQYKATSSNLDSFRRSCTYSDNIIIN